MFGTLRNLLKDEAGATAIEYGLIAALVSVVIIAALTLLGERLQATFDGVAGALPEPQPAEGGGGG